MFHIFIYPNDLSAKPTLWLWTLRDLAIAGAALILSALALAQLGTAVPLIATALFAFLSIRVEDVCVLDFLRYAMAFLCLKQQYFIWEERKN